MASISILDKFINLEYPNREFNNEEKNFLWRYSVVREDNELPILKKIYGKEITSVTKYYKDHCDVQEVKIRFQELRNRFNGLMRRTGTSAFSNQFEEFLKWWVSYVKVHGNKCKYCGVDEETTKAAFDKDSGMLSSKKRSFSGSLQIDKEDPNNGYTEDNCVLACVLCNNAKSDMISDTDFKEYFGKATRNYWKHIEEQLVTLK